MESITSVKSVACGTEHTVAMTEAGLVYSWGQGEGGLLGHGNTASVKKPKVIESLRGEN